MDWLRQRLADQGGRAGFAAVMDWLLNDPDHGFYGSGRVRFGPQGDFVTSPSLGTAFGELLLRQVTPLLAALAVTSEGPIRLIEWGPGEGQLAAQLGQGLLQLDPPWLQRLELVLVESSGPLRDRQRQHLAPLALPHRWAPSAALAAAPCPGLVLAHELIDALPVERFLWHQGHWHCLEVALAADGSIGWAPGDPLGAETLAVLAGLGLPADGGGRPEGWTSEWCPSLAPWLAQARQGLSQGWLLAIDYAHPASRYYSPQRDGGTLLAHRGQLSSPQLLNEPGLWDITAHGCTTHLEQAAAPAGWQWRGASLQGEVLLQLGLAAEISALSTPGPLDLPQRLARREQLLRLVDPHLLGGFWWMLLATADAPGFPGDRGELNCPGWWP
jgi:SAM-dependent MidA family methyltransferase